MVPQVIHYAGSPTKKPRYPGTALMVACSEGLTAIAVELVGLGSDPNFDTGYWNVRHLAQLHMPRDNAGGSATLGH